MLRQVTIFALAYLCYSVVRAIAEVNGTIAFDHAYDVVHLESSLHVFVEPSIQAWARGSDVLLDVASWLYVNAQTSLAIAALLYIYLVHHRAYDRVRNRLVIAMAIALIGYIVFPTAPPRFLPEWGFTDTVANLTHVTGTHDNAAMTGLVNPYAAVPSMHVAVALLLGSELRGLMRRRALRVFWTIYPLLIAFVVIVTANHFIFDVVLGAATAGVSAYLAAKLPLLRPLAIRLRTLTSTAGARG